MDAPKTPEEIAHDGYDELVGVIQRSRTPGGMDGLPVFDPKAPLLGLALDNAAPMGFDLAGVENGIFAIIGDSGSGRHFAAQLLAMRSRWMNPKLHVTIADPAHGGPKVPLPCPRRELRHRQSPEAVIVVAGSMAEFSRAFKATPGRPLPAEMPMRAALLLRHTPGSEYDLPSPNPDDGPFPPRSCREWLPKARLPRDAGYSEGVLCVWKWRTYLPLAVVASTPEYEYLTARVRAEERAPTVEPAVTA